jgi:ribonuclease P protein component
MTADVTRLKQRADFLRIAGSGRKKVTPGFVLQADRTPTSVMAGQESAAMRVGYTVTRKVGKAVVRNKAKRRLRAIARDVLGDHGMPGFDYVLIGRRTTNSRLYGNLVTELRSALSQVHAGNRHTSALD